MSFLRQARALGLSVPAKSPPIPVALCGLGQIGLAHSRFPRGLYINSAIRRHVAAAWRDQVRAERLCRELSQGWIGADALLPVIARGTDSQNAIRAIQGARALLSNWNVVVSAKDTGKYQEVAFYKDFNGASGSTYAFLLRTLGYPGGSGGTGGYVAAPGGSRLTSDSKGAPQLPMRLGASDHLYLTDLSFSQWLTSDSSNVHLLVDALVGVADFSATVTTTQTVSSTALSRWTSGEGVCMTLVTTSNIGATAANVTISYTNQAGTAGRSTTVALTTASFAPMITARADGWQIRFAADDYGVRSVETLVLSANMGSGVFDLVLFKPLLMVGSMSSFVMYERERPGMLGNMVRLTDTSGGEKPHIAPMTYTVAIAQMIFTYLMGLAWG